VVIAMLDPDKRVDSQGVARLRDAGIAVEHGLLARPDVATSQRLASAGISSLSGSPCSQIYKIRRFDHLQAVFCYAPACQPAPPLLR
jgi:hypothetical protein